MKQTASNDFKTDFGRKAFLLKSKKIEGIRLIEKWIYYGRLPPMTYMVLPSLISAIKSGKLKKEYETILKELNPKGYEEYKKTKQIDSYAKLK